MTSREVVLCAPVRTAIGTFGGSLSTVPAPRLGSIVAAETIKRSGISPESVNSVVLGNVVQAGCGMNPARQAAVKAGVPVNVPALTVNRVCGSGAQAIVSAAQEILTGATTCAIAGGMENMDSAPYLLDKARGGYRLGDGRLIDSMLRDGLVDAFSDKHSGLITEALAEEMQISREAQDMWAERSQKRFATAQGAGHFRAEIVGVEVPSRRGGGSATLFDNDEHNRPNTTLASLASIKPAFSSGGTITAGNAPGLNSAASAMIVADRAWAENMGFWPSARIAAFNVSGVAPEKFGLGPVPAIQKALDLAGWSIGDIERFEINEAFAAVTIAIMRALDLPEDIVNVEGGAIAHGHPIGATGAILVTRLLHSMKRDRLRKGIVALCIGGGQGIALALETLQ